MFIFNNFATSCWFSLSLHNLLTMHGHRNLKLNGGGVEVLLFWFFNLGASWGGWWSARPDRFTPWNEPRHPLYRRLRGPQGRSGLVQKISPPTGIRSLDRSTRSRSLSSAVGRENNQKGFNTAMRGYAEYEILSLMMQKTWILRPLLWNLKPGTARRHGL